MDNLEASIVFETLLRNYSFMERVDTLINTYFVDGMIEPKNIPELVLLLVQILETRIENKLSQTDTTDLFKIFLEYIMSFNKITDYYKKEINKHDEFLKTYYICVKLAVLKCRFKTQ